MQHRIGAEEKRSCDKMLKFHENTGNLISQEMLTSIQSFPDVGVYGRDRHSVLGYHSSPPLSSINSSLLSNCPKDRPRAVKETIDSDGFPLQKHQKILESPGNSMNSSEVQTASSSRVDCAWPASGWWVFGSSVHQCTGAHYYVNCAGHVPITYCGDGIEVVRFSKNRIRDFWLLWSWKLMTPGLT